MHRSDSSRYCCRFRFWILSRGKNQPEYQLLSCLFLQRQCFFQRRLQINMLPTCCTARLLQKSCAVRRYPRRRMARVAMSVLLFEGDKKTLLCPSYIYCFLVAAGYCHCHLTASVSTKLVYLDELLPLSRNFGPKHCAVSTEDPINHIAKPPGTNHRSSLGWDSHPFEVLQTNCSRVSLGNSKISLLMGKIQKPVQICCGEQYPYKNQ